jgi:hypothetical protein
MAAGEFVREKSIDPFMVHQKNPNRQEREERKDAE